MVKQDSGDYELMSSHELDDLRHEVSILKNNSLKDGGKARVLIDSMDKLAVSINRLITILDDAQKDIIDEYQESKPIAKLNKLLDQNQSIAKALLAISENINNNLTANRESSKSISQYQDTQSSSIYQNNQSASPYQNNSQASPYQSNSPLLQNLPIGNSQSGSYSPNQPPTMNSPMFSMPESLQRGSMNMNAPLSPANMGPSMSPINNNPSMSSMSISPPISPMTMDTSMSPMGFNSPNSSANMNPSMSSMGGGNNSPISPMNMDPSMDDLPPIDAIPPLDNPPPMAPKKKFLGIM